MNTPQPGNLVCDELGRVIVSYSSLTQFRNCRRGYKRRYIDYLVPLMLDVGDPRNFGKCIHDALETLRKAENVNDAIDTYWGDIGKRQGGSLQKLHEAFEWRERARAAMQGYRERWFGDENQADHHWQIEVLEGRFTGDLVNPETGEVHQRYSIGGKIDLGVRVLRPCMRGTAELEPGLYLGETKTWARVDGEQLKRLWTNFQILMYSHYMQDAMGEPVIGVLYDVIGKAKSIGHTEAETQAEFDQRVKEQRVKAEAGELGTRLKQKKGAAAESDSEFTERRLAAKNPGRLKQREGKPAETDEAFRARRIEAGQEQVLELKPVERESDESFRARLDASYSNPNMYHRELVPLDPQMVRDVLEEMWETLIQHDEAGSRNRWGKNESSCFNFNRACDYWGICRSLDNPTTIEENFRIHTPHSEQDANPQLPITQE